MGDLGPFYPGGDVSADDLRELEKRTSSQFPILGEIYDRNLRSSPHRWNGSIIRQFKVVSVGLDYLTCHTWDGITEGGASIIVLRPYLLRSTPFDGLVREGVSYHYLSPTLREATYNGTTETQVISPTYLVGDLIYGVGLVRGGIDGGSGWNSSLQRNWLDLNVDARAWACLVN